MYNVVINYKEKLLKWVKVYVSNELLIQQILMFLKVILVGAMSGLFAMVLSNMPDNRLLIKVEGVTTIYSILGQKNMDFLFIICGLL